MLKRVLPVAVLAAIVMAAPALAEDGESFTFEGAGWGHAVGLSQWGAYGQAQEDPSKPGEQIAAYYYPGSQPGSLSDLDLPNDLLTELEYPIWVNIASRITLLEFTALGGPLELCLAGDGEGPCPKPERPQQGERWEFRRIDRGECGFFTNGKLQGTSGDCRASISWPEATGIRLRYGPDRSKPCSASRGECEYRHGELKLRDDPVEEGFHVVLTIGLEDYVRGIYEIFPTWEAPGVNQAQAVAARTYAVYKFFANEVEDRPANPTLDPGLRASRKDSCWCHLYDNTKDQVYAGWYRQTEPDHSAWIAGVEATRGRVLTYFGPEWERYTKGGVIQSFFSTSSGGISSSNRYGFFTEWNRRTPSVSQWPYLVPVEDPWDVDPTWGNPHASWRVAVSASKIAGLLEWDEVREAILETQATLDSPARVRFEGTDGGKAVALTVAGAWLRYGLGLKTSNILAIDDRPAPPPEEPVEPEGPTDEGGGQTPATQDIPYDELPPFQDIEGSPHEHGIRALRQAGIADGCDTYSLEYCPDDEVTRATMAAYLVRALEDLSPLSAPYEPEFTDVRDTHRHAPSIYALREAEITLGCGDGTRFCPRESLTRGAMATFLTRALKLDPLDSLDGRRFEDVPDDHAHRGSIYAIAAQGVTIGCGDGTRFCPDDPLTRGAIATFLARAFLWNGPSPPDGNE